jgi:CDP-diacylglycerol--glycerol-3-phosphate 3-phosphatidyltransferase
MMHAAMLPKPERGKGGPARRTGWIANALTISRIFLSLLLPFLKPMQTAFMIVYAVCGATDALDGFAARKTHTQSSLGARLDSLADIIMIAAIILSLYPVIRLPQGAVILIPAIAAIRIASATVSRVKHKAFASLHTYANKLTGFLIFLFPFLIMVLKPAIAVWIICGAAALSAAEELLIQTSSKTLNLDRKSFFSKE